MLALLLLATSLAPIDIIRSAVELSEKTDHLRWNYDITQENIQRASDKTTSKTYELTYAEGKPRRRLVSQDGKSVDGKFEVYKPDAQRRLEMLRELPKAFDFTLLADENVGGHDCWVLMAKPKPGYKPPSLRATFLTQMEGRVWIAKKHNRLVKLDAQTLGPVSFGWFLAKLSPGTRISLEQTQVDDEVWLPKRFKMTYDGRVMFKSIKGEIEQIHSNFRRVSRGT